MIVEERGIPVWTRVRLPPGPLHKKCRNCGFKNEIHYYGIFIKYYFQDMLSYFCKEIRTQNPGGGG